MVVDMQHKGSGDGPCAERMCQGEAGEGDVVRQERHLLVLWVHGVGPSFG